LSSAFWTFGCRNCTATLPNLEALYAEHRGADFEIVGVHSPEFDYEKDHDAIAAAAQDLGVTWPIALDTLRRSFWSWQGSPAIGPEPACSTVRGTYGSTISVRGPTRS
jgi:thiol-disulfide isomerase/thioredoxin